MVPHGVHGPHQRARIRARDRARLVSTRKPVYVPQRDSFRIYSVRADAEYAVYPVEVDSQLTDQCECQAGMNGMVCWHAALITAFPQEVARRARQCAERQAARVQAAQARSEDFADWLTR